VSIALWSCHSTETNYKESYDKAVAASRTGEKGVLYQQELENRKKANKVVDGDSIRMLNHHFNIVDDKSDIIKKYNVVVAEFKQKFNAQSYRDRLRKEEGRNAFVVYIAAKKLYCVVAYSNDDLSAAAEFAKNPEEYIKLKVLVPRAWVLTR
jgi:hypothetical protein